MREDVEKVTVTERSAGAVRSLVGWLPPVQLTEGQEAVLKAAAHCLIPGGGHFPPADRTGMLFFLTRYIAPEGQDARLFPFLEEREVRLRLDELGEPFLSAQEDERVEALRALELAEPRFFTALRDLVYHAYYAQPEVTRAINRELDAGRDYRGAPQPLGYSDVLLDWDEELVDRVRGSYTKTEDVVRVPIPEGLTAGRPLADDARHVGSER
ncbi:gluconate 2-dehydrogenase subunit 3 family protein [Actinokineospora guangxiensis]|uniref:Gluconate 2-dehydrogenase subunit 3 family protein n=1 Tax=Actinokineospora guangxiensis TaxID=1490288 RepID=A0ABW0EVE7_9PSEU